MKWENASRCIFWFPAELPKSVGCVFLSNGAAFKQSEYFYHRSVPLASPILFRYIQHFHFPTPKNRNKKENGEKSIRFHISHPASEFPHSLSLSFTYVQFSSI
jgi:hypothetical protein